MPPNPMEEDWTQGESAPAISLGEPKIAVRPQSQSTVLLNEPRNWSEAELNQFVQDGIFRIEHNIHEHVALQPYWLADPLAGANEELQTQLGKWSARMSGYLVAFKNVQILNDKPSSCTRRQIGFIYQDQPWIHLDVGARFYLYTPTVGQVLKGTVARKASKSVTCVMFNSFSVNVLPTSLEQLRSWRVGDELSFEIISFQNRRKGPLIQGKVEALEFQTQVDPIQECWDKNKVDPMQECWDTSKIDPVLESEVDETAKKKKKKKQGKETEDDVQQTKPIEEEEPPKKKKKKHKNRDNEFAKEEEDEIEINTTDPDPHHKKKKKKKKHKMKEEVMDWT